MNLNIQAGVREGVWRALTFLTHLRLMALLICFGVAGGVLFYTYSRAVYQSRALIRYEITPPSVAADSRDGQVADARDLRDMLGSNYIIERTAMRLGLTKQMGAYEMLRDTYVPKIEIGIIDQSNMQVDVYSYDPSLVSKWQQAMVEEFNTYYYERRKQQRETRSKAFQEELASLSRRMEQEQTEKRTFEEENSITELFVKQAGLTQVPREMVMLRHQLAQMDQLKKNLNSETLGVAEKLALLNSFESEGGTTLAVTAQVPNPGSALDSLTSTQPQLGPAPAAATPAVIVPGGGEANAESWRKLERERQRLNEQVEIASQTFLPGHPRMRELLGKRDETERALQGELAAALGRFNAKYTQISDNVARLEAQLPDYREINRKFQDFRQTFALKQNRNLAWADAYAALAKKLASMEYIGDTMPAHVEFLGHNLMRDQDPVSPPKFKLLMMSVVLGLALGVAVPYGLQRINDTLSRLDDAQDSLHIQGLGVVPVYTREELENIVRSPGIDAEHPDRLLEDFRIIRSSIALNRDVTIGTQAIMVTSARPGEGKSTIAANLAWAFASMGDKTLLIDSDLRRGRLHHVLDADNSHGLCDVVVHGKSPFEVIQSSALRNLDFLARGPITPGATEGLCQHDFAAVMQELRQRYTRIVIDTPPVLGLSEAASLQRVVDGTVLVVLAERTPQRDIHQALDLLRKSGGRLYGFVLNRLDLKKAANYYHYSYYSPYYYDALPNEA